MIDNLALFLFQLGAVLVAAKLGGEIFQRFLKQPAVLGELAMGMAIGPYALGKLPIPGIGPLFPYFTSPGQALPGIASSELYLIAQISIIVLLFSAGLGTDFKQFFKFAGPASLVALGGIIFSFFFGAYAALLFGMAGSIFAPQALFIGTIISATSTGVTARILRDLGKLGTSEGISTLAADVIDDVLGILVLTLVLGLTTAGTLNASEALVSVGKAVGFWLALTAIAILVAKALSRFVISLKVAGAAVAIALALALLTGGLAQTFGLATIIGAYSIGLALSNTELATILEKPIDTLHHVFVPIFFVVMGMLVDFSAMGGGVLLFGLAITAFAILGKVLGCGLPALIIGFNRWGATRIAFGMLPRGEVALIVAGVGLTRGIIPPQIFGVTVMIIMVTVLLTPIALTFFYKKGGEGRTD